MSINAESVQHLDPLKYLLDLPRRVLGRCRPEPALQGGAAVVRLRDRGAPLGEQQRIVGVMNTAGERRLVASDRLGGSSCADPARAARSIDARTASDVQTAAVAAYRWCARAHREGPARVRDVVVR
jgi:hypothetical protein